MARKRKRLVIHIGMHKTGSTTIQRFLSRNRLVLRLAGVLYPESCGADGRRTTTTAAHGVVRGAARGELLSAGSVAAGVTVL